LYALLWRNCHDIFCDDLINEFIVSMTMWLPVLAEGSAPKYKKLADAIELAIAQGQLAINEKLPPQRILADALRVTVGTITRAYNEAERRGCVLARVGSGTFVKSHQVPDYLTRVQSSNIPYFDLRSANAPQGMQLEMLAEALTQLAGERQVLRESLSYQAETALLHQRQYLVDWLAPRGVPCLEHNVIFTYGGQHGISLSLQAVCRAGDTVLCEALSFPGISITCQQQQIRCIGLAMDDCGVTPASLLAAIAQGKPRVLYLTAQIQNPTCTQMPEARKRQIVDICRQHDLLILEDDVQFLPQADKQPSFYALAPELTIYISSFAKCFSGGLRVGYLVANPNIREQIRISLRASCWTVSPLLVELLCRWLANGKMAQVEAWLAEEMQARTAILQQILAGYQFNFQTRGFTVWLTLPEHWRAVDFERYAEQQHLLIRAAESYAVGRVGAPQNIRLTICAAPTRAALTQALLLLKRCLMAQPSTADLAL
jgi:DNA-binding transcriptional MocR family regulator